MSVKSFIKAIIIIAFFVFFFLVCRDNSVDHQIIEINGNFLKAEIATNKQTRKEGLSKREELDFNKGLLFIFDKLDYHSIWMKDMNFALDIIWMDEDGYIVDCKENVLPATFPEAFYPEKPAKYILEVKAGFISQQNLTIGDKLEI